VLTIAAGRGLSRGTDRPACKVIKSNQYLRLSIYLYASVVSYIQLILPSPQKHPDPPPHQFRNLGPEYYTTASGVRAETRGKLDRSCHKYNKVVGQGIQEPSSQTERMASQILAFSVFKAKQIEAPVVGKIPAVGIQRIDQGREQPIYRISVS
jgi:hypothetical protein